MEDYGNEGIRGLLPPRARALFRKARERGLSIGIRPLEDVSLPEEEGKASSQLSIVPAVHDSPDVTERCLRSLELFGGQSEVIVVDDGSKLEATRRLLDAACSRNGWRLIRNETAQGHSRASEAGVAASTRPYVCLLNSDTIVTPRSWAGVVRAFEESPQIAVVGPSTSHTSTAQIVPRALHCRHTWSDGQIWFFAERYASKHRRDPLVDLEALGGFAFFVRRAIWDMMGGFDKNLPDYGNETELCVRLRQRGFRLVWTKGSYIHHLSRESYGRSLGVAAIRQRSEAALTYIKNKIF